MKQYEVKQAEQLQLFEGGACMEGRQPKAVPAKRIQLVDVVLERKGSQLFSGRRVRSPHDAAHIIRDFIGDSDRERFFSRVPGTDTIMTI